MSQETSQLTLPTAPVNRAVNQASFQANPVQSYIANRPYFNQIPGKGVMSQAKPMLTLVPRLISQQANTVNGFSKFPAALKWVLKADNKLDRITQGQKKKTVSKLLENKKIFPVSPSGTIPLSIMENIPILKSYKGSRLVISRSNSYLLHKLFPFEEKSNKSSRPPTLNRYPSAMFYSKPLTQNRFLPNSIAPFSRDTRLDNITSHPVKTDTARNQLKIVPALPSDSSSYTNQNIMFPFPLVNSYPKDRKFLYHGITHRFNYPERKQSWTNPSSYFKPQVKLINNQNFQISSQSTKLANDVTFGSPLNNEFYTSPRPGVKEDKFNSAGDKVVTEGELKEKGLFSNILSRDHIRHKPGKKAKEQVRENKSRS